MDWIVVAQHKDRWKAHVNAVNEPSGPINWGEILD